MEIRRAAGPAGFVDLLPCSCHNSIHAPTPGGPRSIEGGNKPNEGVSPMAHASSSKARPGRSHALAAGGLLLAGLFCLSQFTQAQQADPKGKTPPEGKKPAPPAVPAFK